MTAGSVIMDQRAVGLHTVGHQMLSVAPLGQYVAPMGGVVQAMETPQNVAAKVLP